MRLHTPGTPAHTDTDRQMTQSTTIKKRRRREFPRWMPMRSSASATEREREGPQRWLPMEWHLWSDSLKITTENLQFNSIISTALHIVYTNTIIDVRIFIRLFGLNPLLSRRVSTPAIPVASNYYTKYLSINIFYFYVECVCAIFS